MDYVDLKGKKILVTGGNGYLGRNFINILVALNFEVYSFDIQINFSNPKAENHQIDLTNETLLKEKINAIKPDIIFHLAASLNRKRNFSEANNLFKTNLTSTINLLNALEDVLYENFIFVSTSEVYGGSLIQTPFKENDNFVPASPYSLSKYCAEMSVKTYSNIYKKNFTILRLFNFYGKNMPESFFLPQLVDKLEKNIDFDMTLGEQKRDFISVYDVYQAMLLACSKKAYQQTFNVCSGEGKSIKNLALEFKKLLKSDSKINFGAIPYRKNEVWDMTGDNSRIKDILGWTPKLTVFDAYKSETGIL